MRQRLKRTAKAGWRKARKYLPDGVANAIANPTKRALRRFGLMQNRRRPNRPKAPARARS